MPRRGTGITVHCGGNTPDGRRCSTDYDPARDTCPNCGAPKPTKGRIYRIRVMVGGCRISRTADSEDMAKKIHAKLKGSLDDGIIPKKPTPPPTLNVAWQRFLDSYRARGAKGWRQEETRYARYLKPIFGPMRLDLIDSAAVERFMNRMLQTKSTTGKIYAPRTVRHMVELLTRIYRYAVKMQLFRGDIPTRPIDLPKIDNQVDAMLQGDQMARLLDVLDRWEDATGANWIRFLLFTGCRAGEAAKLRWDAVDLIQKTAIFKQTKAGRSTRIPLNELAVDALLRQKAIGINNSLCFPSVTGIVRSNYHKLWRPIARAAGIPDDFRAHDLRHSLASWLVSSGRVDLYAVQRLLGHSTVKMTERYAFLAPGALRGATDVMADLVANARQGANPPDPPAGNVIDLDERRRGRA